MGKINSRSKGANGEREAARWLQQKFKLEKLPERNLEQVRHGGFDLNGFEPFAMEIKRCETLSLRNWWVQVVNACDIHHIPVVMYRRNREKWRFLISAKNLGLKNGYVRLEEREFILWAKLQMENEYEGTHG